MNQKNVLGSKCFSENNPETGLNFSIFVLFGVSVTACIAFFIWACTFTVDIVSIANGEVIPSSQVKSVQHLEGGIILE